MILITGSKGYVGDHLLRALKKRGHEVVELVGNITDKESIRDQFKSGMVVIHLAAKIDDRRDDTYFDVNVGGTMNIVSLCIENDCKLIYVSSVETRGEYGITKQLAENLVARYAQEGLQAVTVRPTSIKFSTTTGFSQMHVFLNTIDRALENNDTSYRVYTMKSQNPTVLFRAKRFLKRFL
jgi:dihydroflavonol-4-reductase